MERKRRQQNATVGLQDSRTSFTLSSLQKKPLPRILLEQIKVPIFSAYATVLVAFPCTDAKPHQIINLPEIPAASPLRTSVMEESRDFGVTRPSENQQCHSNNTSIAPSPYNSNSIGSADRDARKLEYSMRSSEYNAKNIIQTTSDHTKDVTSGCYKIPVNMTASKYQPTPSCIKYDRPDIKFFMEKNDGNNTTKHRKLDENVSNSDDSHVGKSSKIAKCAAVSADTCSDKMDSRSSHDFGSSFPSNEYSGYSIDGSLDDETFAHIESSPSNSPEPPEPIIKIHNWNIPLGNSWGSFEFSHGTLSGVLSDILTEKSGIFSDHKTTPSVYSTTGRKSRSSSFNGTGGGLFHTKKRNSTNTKKFESSIKSSMELYSDEKTNERIVLDYRKYSERKRFRADEDCDSTEEDDNKINLTLETRKNVIQPASFYNNNSVVVINNNNSNNSNNTNDKNNKNSNSSGKQTVQGYKYEKNERINDTIHLDFISNKHEDQSNTKNDFYVFNQIGNSGSFSTEKRYDNYDLYLRNCFEGNEECSESNARRILKSHAKLDMKINSPNFRLRLVLYIRMLLFKTSLKLLGPLYKHSTISISTLLIFSQH